MTAPSVAANGNNGPTVWTHGDHQFTIEVDAASNLIVSHFDRTDRSLVERFDLSDLALAISPLDDSDGHSTAAIAVDPNGIIHVWGNNRSNLGEIRAVRSTAPLDIGAWSDQGDDFNALPGHTYNYFKPRAFSDGELFTMWRERLPDGHGTEYAAVMETGETDWTHRGAIFQGGGGTEHALYRTHPFIDANDRIHMFGAWDSTYVEVTVGQHSYVYSDDRGVTWRNIAGTALSLPISRDNASGVACRTGIDLTAAPVSAAANLYSHACAVDGDGYPCGTYSSETPDRQYLIRWDGTAWTQTHLSHVAGGVTCNIVPIRGELWTLARNGAFIELRRLASPNETVRLGGRVGSGWFPHYDPVALAELGSVECFVADRAPVVRSFGAGARRAAAA